MIRASHPLVRSLITLLASASLVRSADSPHQAKPVTEFLMTNGTLSVRFRDNSESPKVLSGLQSLFHRDAARFDAFDPDSPGASAGLNFEHIISGHKNDANRFSPRHGPYSLFQSEDGASAFLKRRAADSPWAVESTLNYTLADSNALDFEFECVPRQNDPFGSRGYAVFFFADYMNDVRDPALHFRGVRKEGAEEEWIRAPAPQTHPDYNGGGTYRAAASSSLEYDADHNFKLNLWSYDYPRFSQPFYYGRAAHDMVLILMFDRAWTERDEIRFSLFKFKLPRHPRPAWDFQYVIHKVTAGQTYGFKGRLVWKKFVSPEDCWEEYRRWAKPRVPR